jgi:hypothetical protein
MIAAGDEVVLVGDNLEDASKENEPFASAGIFELANRYYEVILSLATIIKMKRWSKRADRLLNKGKQKGVALHAASITKVIRE